MGGRHTEDILNYFDMVWTNWELYLKVSTEHELEKADNEIKQYGQGNSDLFLKDTQESDYNFLSISKNCKLS